VLLSISRRSATGRTCCANVGNISSRMSTSNCRSVLSFSWQTSQLRWRITTQGPTAGYWKLGYDQRRDQSVSPDKVGTSYRWSATDLVHGGGGRAVRRQVDLYSRDPRLRSGATPASRDVIAAVSSNDPSRPVANANIIVSTAVARSGKRVRAAAGLEHSASNARNVASISSLRSTAP